MTNTKLTKDHPTQPTKPLHDVLAQAIPRSSFACRNKAAYQIYQPIEEV